MLLLSGSFAPRFSIPTLVLILGLLEVSLAQPTPAPSDYPNKVMNASTEHWISRWELFSAETPAPDGVVFIGDSITERFPLSTWFPGSNAVNRGIGGDKVGGWIYYGVRDRLGVSVTSVQPKTIVMLIGINDIAFAGTPVSLLQSQYDLLITEIQAAAPSAQIVLVSVLPVKIPNSTANTQIVSFNSYIQSVAAARGAEFLNLHPLFKDASGQLRTDLADDDVHVNAEGYRIWSQALNPVIGIKTVDNADGSPRYVEAGSWGASGTAGWWGGGSRYANVYNQPQNNTVTWKPVLAKAGVYKVYGWWVAAANRSPGAAYYVNHKYGSTLARVNQQSNGGAWNLLGEFTFDAGETGTVQLSSADSYNGGNTSAVVSADAVEFVYQNAEPVIVDNASAGFSASSNWFSSSSVSGYLGTNYHARSAAQTTDPAVWSADLSSSGTYKVYARWTAATNRATAAPYVVVASTGEVTVNVNQQQNNGAWVLLGEWPMSAGNSARVKLSCWTTSGQYVVADAVKLVLKD